MNDTKIQPNDMVNGKVAQAIITNLSPMQASRYIKAAREFYKKKEHQILTAKEFSTYYGVSL